MSDDVYPAPTADLSRLRRALAPEAAAAFHAFGQAVFPEGSLFAHRHRGNASGWWGGEERLEGSQSRPRRFGRSSSRLSLPSHRWLDRLAQNKPKNIA